MKEERYKKILEKLNRQDIVTIGSLSQELNVAKMTIRRDLTELEKKGVLKKVHGGATRNIPEHLENERLYLERREKNIESKKYVARIAAKIIEEGDVVYIGPGTTTERILDYVSGKKITVVTNSLSIITKYYNNLNIRMMILGGIVRNDSEAITPDYFLDSIRKINVDKCFVGTNGISETKITTSTFGEGLVEEVLLNNSKQRYVVTDSSKFNKEAIYSFLNPEILTAVITDSHIEKKELNRYRKIYNVINK